MSSSEQPNRRRKTTTMSSSSQPNRTSVVAGLYLPVECWECIISFLKDENHSLKSLSVVCKQFLTITNRLRSSLTICDQTLPFLHFLFHRFNNLTSLDLSRLDCNLANLDSILCGISCYPLKLTSLNLSNKPGIPAKGLRAFSKKFSTLTSLTCSKMNRINNTDIFLISDCFPLLEVLDLSYPYSYKGNQDVEHLSFKFSKLRKVNLSGLYYFDNKLLFRLFKNCKLLEEAIMLTFIGITFDDVASALRKRPTLKSVSFSNNFGQAFEGGEESYITSQFITSLVSLQYLTCFGLVSSNISDELLFSIANKGLPLTRLVLQDCAGYSYSGIFYLLSKCRHCQHLDLENAVFLTDKHVVELSLFLGDLVSINLSRCSSLTISAFFALIKSCPSLSDIKMENTNIGKMSPESSISLMDFTAHHQLKNLRLARNPWLTDENIIMIASISPNLQLLDLSDCNRIKEGIVQVLSMCCNIRHLNLLGCSRAKLSEMNFKVPKLEVLNLSHTNVDDETLYVISKSCCGLLRLLLEYCRNVTEKGVEHVVENCMQLEKHQVRWLRR